MKRYAAAVALLLLAGCSTSTPPAPAVATATAPDGANDVDADLPTPAPPPVTDAQSDAAALQLATDAMTSFTQVTLPADQWFADLAPYLTEQTAQSYTYVDPLEVPARAVTGPASIAPTTSAYLAQVIVPTDVGDYRLLLVRDGAGEPWLTQTITPPDGVQ